MQSIINSQRLDNELVKYALIILIFKNILFQNYQKKIEKKHGIMDQPCCSFRHRGGGCCIVFKSSGKKICNLQQNITDFFFL